MLEALREHNPSPIKISVLFHCLFESTEWGRIGKGSSEFTCIKFVLLFLFKTTIQNFSKNNSCDSMIL